MRILFCCQFYAPSIGGVQEVMRQLAERLAARGHDVMVATTKLSGRDFEELNGVQVREFEIEGNQARGLKGQIEAYIRFVRSMPFDVIMINAAQQWTFDALWQVLDNIRAAKILIPCGFSGLYERTYADYFDQLPAVLRKFDHLVFNASDYRDIRFTKKHGIGKFSIIPNGASEVEFAVDPDPLFRQRHSIGADDLLFLTVGSFTREKGHLEVASAFLLADFDGRPATLILNGNGYRYPENRSAFRMMRDKVGSYNQVVREAHESQGFGAACAYVLHGVINKVGIRAGRYATDRKTFREDVQTVIDKIHSQGSHKRVLMTDLPRPDLVQAYMNADLFVFASHIECSPLVLFESVAAGTPFLSVAAGNAAEIAEWTGGGVICPASQDECGYTNVDPKVFGEQWAHLASNRAYLRQLGGVGKQNWAARFTWEKITGQYENVFRKVATYAQA